MTYLWALFHKWGNGKRDPFDFFPLAVIAFAAFDSFHGWWKLAFFAACLLLCDVVAVMTLTVDSVRALRARHYARWKDVEEWRERGWCVEVNSLPGGTVPVYALIRTEPPGAGPVAVEYTALWGPDNDIDLRRRWVADMPRVEAVK